MQMALAADDPLRLSLVFRTLPHCLRFNSFIIGFRILKVKKYSHGEFGDCLMDDKRIFRAKASKVTRNIHSVNVNNES